MKRAVQIRFLQIPWNWISHGGSSLAGPRRPQDRVLLSEMSQSFKEALPSWEASKGPTRVEGMDHELSDGDVVIASHPRAATSASDPSRILVAAGLQARNAVARGLATSLG